MFNFPISRLRFIRSEEGAVSIGWLTLTVSALTVLLAVMTLVSGGIENLAEDTRNALANAHPEEGISAGLAAQGSGDASL
ncbi:hypothetical protein HKCCSP123_06765 [Rhodobacterales bacterium HKCCSP123]|nr:hypothetical protein [Rhodobacterales bacterium HKCCSP123]